MKSEPSVTVLINNYNYERYISVAIESALDQVEAGAEVVVVDDGSTDGSRELIRSYGERITAIFKENGGQASAVNAGLQASRGGAVISLDADDGLLPGAVERISAAFSDPKVVKVHWDLEVARADGTLTGKPARRGLVSGDLQARVLEHGAEGFTWPQMSGNAWARWFLEEVSPIPENEIGTHVDYYLNALAPLYGTVGYVNSALSFWRHHSSNRSASRPFQRDLELGLACAERTLQELEQRAQSLGLPVNPGQLRHNSRWHQMAIAVERIGQITKPGDRVILIDQDHWQAGGSVAGRTRFHLVQKDGKFWGVPGTDEMAIEETGRLRAAGATHLIVVWPYLWWLEHFKKFDHWLRQTYRMIQEDDRLVAFDLTK